MLYWGGNPHSFKDMYIESCIHFWVHWTSLVVKCLGGQHDISISWCSMERKNMNLKKPVSLPLLLLMDWGVEPNHVVYHQMLECGRLTFIVILPYSHYNCSNVSILIIICVVPLQCHVKFVVLFKIFVSFQNLWNRFCL